MIEFDVETTGSQWYHHELFLVQFFDGNGEAAVLRHPEDRAVIQAWLDRDDDFRAWNSKFDLHFLMAAGYKLPPQSRWHDGMVGAVLIDERKSMALKGRAEQLFGPSERDSEKALKTWLKEETARRREHSKATGERMVLPTYRDVPMEIMHPYGAQDVYLSRSIGEIQDMALGNSNELRELYEMEMVVMGAIFDAETYGIPVDERAARLYEIDLAAEMEELESEAKRLAGISTFNVRSPQQLYQTLKRVGADLQFVTGESMDEENLSTVDHPLAGVVLKYRAVKKVYDRVRPMLHGEIKKGFELGPFIAPDGRLHPSFNQVGAKTTGRMSASNPNVQNFNRDNLGLRYLVRAEPGYKLVTADLDSIELKLFAAYAGEGRLLEMVLDPEADPHTYTANMVGLLDFVRTDGSIEPLRQRGKTFNYSMLYGAGVRSVRKHFRTTQPGAKDMIRRYHDAYPEVGKLQRIIEHRLYQRGFIQSQWGRRFHVNPRDSYKATNYLVQGTAADLLKASIARLHREGVPLIGFVHDELIAHVPEGDAEEVAHMIQEALVDHPRITAQVPLGAEAKIVDRWSDAKTPGFVPDYDRKEIAA